MVKTKFYKVMGMQRWLPTRSQSESMSKSRHDHVDRGCNRAGEPIAIDPNYISWLVSKLMLILLLYMISKVERSVGCICYMITSILFWYSHACYKSVFCLCQGRTPFCTWCIQPNDQCGEGEANSCLLRLWRNIITHCEWSRLCIHVWSGIKRAISIPLLFIFDISFES